MFFNTIDTTAKSRRFVYDGRNYEIAAFPVRIKIA